MSGPSRRAVRMMATVASASWLVLYLADRIVSGVVQCSALGCLPHGVA